MTINSEYMFFKLGRNKELAKAEISTIFEKAGINRKINYFQWKEFLFVNIEKKEEQNILRKIRETGSVVKVGCCFAKCGSETEVREIIQEKNNQIINKFSGKKEKIKFSINLQIEQLKQKTISEIVRKEILKIAKDRRVEVKIIPKKGYSLELSPYQYHKENMPKRGVELVIFGIKSKIYLGETKWVTNPFFDIKLDEGRPERLFTHGTSIKIARSLINLTNTKNDGKIVDPFSGTGTLLIVGLLQNYDVIGFEKDPKCVRVAKTNIRWAIDKYKIKKPFLFIIYSLSIWFLYLLMVYTCFFSLPQTSMLSLSAGLTVLVLGSIGIMITPGGIGLYPVIVARVNPFGIPCTVISRCDGYREPAFVIVAIQYSKSEVVSV